MLIRLVNNYCVDSLVACMRDLVLPDLAFWKALIITSQDYNIIHASMKYPNNNISLVIDPTLYICYMQRAWLVRLLYNYRKLHDCDRL